jgi:rare lipoprotein A
MRKIATIAIFMIALCGCSVDTVEQLRITKSYQVKASWYECCKKTANGEKFDPEGMTAAHRSLRFGTRLKLTNPSNGKSVIVRINDRGPFIKGVDLDVSRGVAKHLDIIKKGHAKLLVDQLAHD